MYTIHWIQFGPLWIWWAWMQHSYGPWSWQTLLCFGGGKSIFSGWYKFHDPNTWKKKEIDKVWFRLNPLTEQNCEKEKKEINMKQQWVLHVLPWLSSLYTKQVLYMYVPEERESSLLDLHFKQYESHWDLISVFVQERKMAVTYNKIHRKFICLIP